MDSRAEQILECIIDQYVRTADPVGSRALSKLLENKISAATIRNVMSDLTDMGLIAQPYTSAGRIPTDKGYRYYVNHILTIKQTKNLDSKKFISGQGESEGDSVPQSFEDILLGATRELAEVTNCPSVVISPQPAVSRLNKLDLIPISPTQVLVVLVMHSGMVRNKIIHLREVPDKGFLEEMENLLSSYFEGKTIAEIRHSLIDTLNSELTIHKELIPQAIRLGKKAFDLEEQGDLYISGRSNMCAFPEFSDQENLEVVFKVFDEKRALVHFFSKVQNKKNVQIQIGNENKENGLDQCSILATSYGNRKNMLGSIGIIGPTRMNYSQVISAIGYSSQKLSMAVSKFLVS
ncbi:MAG: heat-inducible transcription repressor HrcA [Proteobacteria bacterium]|nr:heat-inducible transcription repressor HrcA [Pseudomonadota bacterium]